MTAARRVQAARWACDLMMREAMPQGEIDEGMLQLTFVPKLRDEALAMKTLHRTGADVVFVTGATDGITSGI